MQMVMRRLMSNATLTFDAANQPVKCAVVGCPENATRNVAIIHRDATATVEYRFCPTHEAVVAEAGYTIRNDAVKPTWEFPAGNWMHDGSDRRAHLHRENQ